MSGLLAGRTVLLTRDGGLADLVRELGAAVRVAPVVVYEAQPCQVDLREYDRIVFTSARAVAYLDHPLSGAPPIACVGPATAKAVVERGGVVDLMPERHTAEDLAAALEARGVRGEIVLFPCSSEALGTLPEALEKAGAQVMRLVVYRPRPARDLPKGILQGADVVVFLAPSAVEAYAALRGDLRGPKVLAIGPTTAEALRSRGIEPAVAESPTREGILAALTRMEIGR